MSSWQTHALRPILRLWVQKCRSPTQRRVLCEVIMARGFRGLSIPSHLTGDREPKSEGRKKFQPGAMKKVWASSPRDERTWATLLQALATPSPPRKVCEEGSTDPHIQRSNIAPQIPTDYRPHRPHRKITVLCSSPHSRAI